MSAILKANHRSGSQKSSLNKLRAEGNIPAVIFGSNVESQPISIDSRDFIKTIREVGRNGIISLDVDGQTTNVMLSEYQQDALKGHVIHADFHAVDMSVEVNATVRIELVGDAAGVKDGGVMQQAVHELSVTATPSNIPQAIQVDVSNLQVNENLTVADLKNNVNYQINDEDSLVLVTILPPKQEEEINSGEKQEEEAPDNVEGRETEPSES